MRQSDEAPQVEIPQMNMGATAPIVRTRDVDPVRCGSRFRRVRNARWVVGAACWLLISVRAVPARTRIWIDTDPSIGAPYREVDDAFALIFAFHSPELRIAGISTTYGNAGVKRTTTVAQDLAHRFGAPAGISERDVYPGAANRQSSGIPTPATAGLARSLQQEQLTYVAIGPLTNLATCLKLHPELAARIERVIFVGGRTVDRPLKFGALEIHDANVLKDPMSVQAVLNTNIPILLAPPEVAGRLILTRDAAHELASDGPAAVFLQRNTRVWLWFWTSIIKNPGGPLFDSLGMILATKPELVPTRIRYARIDGGELMLTPERRPGAVQVRVCADFGRATTKLMLQRLQARSREAGARAR